MLIYGIQPIKTLFYKKPFLIKEVYINKKRHQSFYFELKKDSKIKIFEYSKAEKRLFKNNNDQEIVAKIVEPNYFGVKELIERNRGKKNPVILILDQITDPHNYGAILRNVSAFGGNGIILSKYNTVSLTPSAIKASAGNWINVDIAEEVNLKNAIKMLKDNGYWIVSTVMKSNKTLNDLKKFQNPLGIILGNENKGIKQSLIKDSDLLISIPMKNNTESLNVSVTAAIILYSLS